MGPEKSPPGWKKRVKGVENVSKMGLSGPMGGIRCYMVIFVLDGALRMALK